MAKGQYNSSEYYSMMQLCKVFKASYPTVAKKVKELTEAGELPYEVSPITGRKYFAREVIDSKYLKQSM